MHYLLTYLALPDLHFWMCIMYITVYSFYLTPLLLITMLFFFLLFNFVQILSIFLTWSCTVLWMLLQFRHAPSMMTIKEIQFRNSLPEVLLVVQLIKHKLYVENNDCNHKLFPLFPLLLHSLITNKTNSIKHFLTLFSPITFTGVPVAIAEQCLQSKKTCAALKYQRL